MPVLIRLSNGGKIIYAGAKDKKMDCPLCHGNTALLFTTKDWNRRVTEEIFTYERCLHCGLIFLSDIPDTLDAYYGDDYYQVPSFAKLKKVAMAESYQLEMISKFLKAGRLLEIGPGFGVFAYQAKQAGFEVDIIEREARCCEYLTHIVGVNAVKSDSPHVAIEAMAGHDVIALWHVIEHLPQPWLFLEKAARNLNPGGVLLIATPNPEAFQFRLMASLWPHVDAPRHLFLISAALLIQRLKPFGLEPVFQTTSDKGARSWNRFGWQRYLMNRFSHRWLQLMAFVLGYALSLPMGLWDRKDFAGSAYTIVLRKNRCSSEERRV